MIVRFWKREVLLLWRKRAFFGFIGLIPIALVLWQSIAYLRFRPSTTFIGVPELWNWGFFVQFIRIRWALFVYPLVLLLIIFVTLRNGVLRDELPPEAQISFSRIDSFYAIKLIGALTNSFLISVFLIISLLVAGKLLDLPGAAPWIEITWILLAGFLTLPLLAILIWAGLRFPRKLPVFILGVVGHLIGIGALFLPGGFLFPWSLPIAALQSRDQGEISGSLLICGAILLGIIAVLFLGRSRMIPKEPRSSA